MINRIQWPHVSMPMLRTKQQTPQTGLPSHAIRFGSSDSLCKAPKVQDVLPGENFTLTAMEEAQAQKLEQEWKADPRWKGVERPYTARQVMRLRNRDMSFLNTTRATAMANKLWKALNTQKYVATLGAEDGVEAMEYIRGGRFKAIYLSGWQTAASNNNNGKVFPDLSLYDATSVPRVVKQINNALLAADQIDHTGGLNQGVDWYVPIVADAEAGFGGNKNCYNLMQEMIEAGAAGVHFEDQASTDKKCGHMGGKVLIPTQQAINHLVAARLAADVMGVPTVLVGRTDAEAADLLTSGYDERDKPFLTGARSDDNSLLKKKPGLEAAIARGVAMAPYADVIWCETGKPDLEFARKFAEGIHAKYPGKLLAYNCSPSFNWGLLDEKTRKKFQAELGKMGYKFQFITLAGFHAKSLAAFELARAYAKGGMDAYYKKIQRREMDLTQNAGYLTWKHQTAVGLGHWDAIEETVTGGKSAVTGLATSTEAEQFHADADKKSSKG